MATIIDRNGALWIKTFQVPKGDQIFPWRALSTRYEPQMLIQAFTEEGLYAAVNTWVFTTHAKPLPKGETAPPPILEPPPIGPAKPPAPPVKVAVKKSGFKTAATILGVGVGAWWLLRR